jgi:hypothetical protein
MLRDCLVLTINCREGKGNSDEGREKEIAMKGGKRNEGDARNAEKRIGKK